VLAAEASFSFDLRISAICVLHAGAGFGAGFGVRGGAAHGAAVLLRVAFVALLLEALGAVLVYYS
jgi:hypothetical protein